MLFSPDETPHPLHTYTNKMGTTLCHQVSVQDYSELMLTYSLHTQYKPILNLLPEFRTDIQD